MEMTHYRRSTKKKRQGKKRLYNVRMLQVDLYFQQTVELKEKQVLSI